MTNVTDDLDDAIAELEKTLADAKPVLLAAQNEAEILIADDDDDEDKEVEELKRPSDLKVNDENVDKRIDRARSDLSSNDEKFTKSIMVPEQLKTPEDEGEEAAPVRPKRKKKATRKVTRTVTRTPSQPTSVPNRSPSEEKVLAEVKEKLRQKRMFVEVVPDQVTVPEEVDVETEVSATSSEEETDDNITSKGKQVDEEKKSDGSSSSTPESPVAPTRVKSKMMKPVEQEEMEKLLGSEMQPESPNETNGKQLIVPDSPQHSMTDLKKKKKGINKFCCCS